MQAYIQFLLLGLANGAVFAALATALVVTYRSSGVLNFATGSLSLYAAYVYAYLRQGELLLLVPPLPTKVDIGTSLGFVPAAAIAVTMAAAAGLVLYGLVFRPLRTAAPVAKAVASIGILVVATALIAERIGTAAIAVTNIYPISSWTVGGVTLSQDRVWFALTVVAIAAALTAIFRFTRFGLVTRAAAESEKGAYVSGLSPDRIAALNWLLSGAVAGIAGILIAPIVPLVPVSYTLFIVPALSAAIAGRFQFLMAAVAAGLAIGMLQSEATYLVSRFSWLPASGLSEVIPLVLILLLLVVRARPLPSRGAVIQQSLGQAPRPQRLTVTTAVAAAAGVLALIVLTGDWRAAVMFSMISATICLSLVVVTGYAGQVSLAQLALAGVAAFILSPITVHLGVPFPIAPLLAAACSAVIGVVVGLPALRIRGLPVAIVTLALAVVLEAVWFRNPDLVSSSGQPIKAAKVLGLDLGVGAGATFPRLGFCLAVLVVLVLVAVGVARLRTSRLGSAMLAVRANERAAAAAGVDVVRTKLMAFAIAAFIAGIGGSMLAYAQETVTFESFGAISGLAVFATAYLGGVTSVSGGVLAGFLSAGGLLYVALDKAVDLEGWFNVVLGVGLVLTIVLNPEGLMGPVHAFIARRRSADPGAEKTGLQASHASPAQANGASAGRRDVASRSDTPVLSLDRVSVRYGGVVAVADVSLEVHPGTIVGLIGPNGAGKTTLIDAISGFAPAEGSITLDGVRIDGLQPHRRIRTGLGRTFQAIELYDDLSVAENVLVGLSAQGLRPEGTVQEELDRTFDLVGLGDVRHRAAGDLSQGQRQLVSIARALVGRPEVLLLDEPAGGLDSAESLWLGERLRDLRDIGVTIVLIDHDMHLVLSLCDAIHVLNFGETIAHGSPDEIRADRRVASAYLGSTHSGAAAGGVVSALLECRGLVAGHGDVVAVRELDLTVEPGSVLAVLGPNGAGKTTLLTTLAGLLPRLGGSVLVGGHELPSGRPARARAGGVVLVPDDRALFTGLSVRENLEVAQVRGGPGPEDMIATFPALEKRWDVAAGMLSGGEQQMLAVARALVQRPQVLLIDEMSMGLAPVIVEELLPVVRRVADETGALVVMVEQHVRLALEVADEAIVLVHGEVSLCGSATQLAGEPERLEAAYLGGDAVRATG